MDSRTFFGKVLDELLSTTAVKATLWIGFILLGVLAGGLFKLIF